MSSPAVQFVIQPTSGVPIYRQLMDQIAAHVASGRLAAGELVPSVREIAETLDVNPMTVSKAYARLEIEGVLSRDRGVGMRVAESVSTGRVSERLQKLRPLARQLATQAWQLGLDDEQVLSLVQAVLKDRKS